jgi:hypothetical protein
MYFEPKATFPSSTKPKYVCVFLTLYSSVKKKFKTHNILDTIKMSFKNTYP